MACRKEFTSSKSNLKGVCLNYPETEEEIRAFSQKYYDALVTALKTTFGERWVHEVFKRIEEEEENDLGRKGAVKERINSKDCDS
ncbi:MAG: hypothetical protein J6D47_14080 [Peptostreptococcaceae bacterium]|nr:hypothetical protein [Peptostreptococcaceae bacterium]